VRKRSGHLKVREPAACGKAASGKSLVSKREFARVDKALKIVVGFRSHP
jgi:hypothetical protein